MRVLLIKRLMTGVSGVNRVLYDLTPKSTSCFINEQRDYDGERDVRSC